MEGLRVYDMHVHLHEYSDREVEEILDADRSLVVVAVSDDLESAWRTLDLWHTFGGRVVPCLGFHPWNVREGRVWEAWEVLRLAYRYGVPCLGEAGLDRRFVDEYTWRVQNEVFDAFVQLAEDMGVMLNIHAPDAWRHVAHRIGWTSRARFMYHWYTGPATLPRALPEGRVWFSINSAIRVQEKSVRVAREIPLRSLVVESDGPYNYRGLRLSPLMVRETVKLVAEARGEDPGRLMEAISLNSERLLGLL
ncbi:putative deoxyribonuclease [Aeropyrum pernix]|uniref:Putative deoxyribonuclease n=1 Tax=Aeropyrum pernix TaxID=56636 RepID=A0A401HA48_AERPX|nr:putative deoxyribonuclease [Aeropyrum pernix]